MNNNHPHRPEIIEEQDYQFSEKNRMKWEAEYSLNKGELTTREYENRILNIIEWYNDITRQINAWENIGDC